MSDICPRCNEVHEPWPRCSAHSRQTKKQCGRKVPDGHTVCRFHGANGRHAARVERDLAERDATERLAKLIGPSTPVMDARDELARVAGDIVATQKAARELVAGLEQAGNQQPYVGGDDLTPPPGNGLLLSTATGTDLHPLVKLVERFDDRARSVLADMVKLGLVERQVQIDEHDSQVLETVLIEVLTEAGVDLGRVLPAIGEKLRALEACGDVIDAEVLDDEP